MDLPLYPINAGHAASSHSDSERKNIFILFIEVDSAETSKLISCLRDLAFAPRGKNIDSIAQLNQSLSERSWDIIIYRREESRLTTPDIIQQLHLLEKDLPVIQLVNDPSQEIITQGLLDGLQAVLPIENMQVVLLHIQREFKQLSYRRKARQLQLKLSESQKRCKVLMDNSSLAIAFIYNQKIVYLNQAFSQLFGYPLEESLLNQSALSLLAPQERNGISKLISTIQDNPQAKQSYQVLALRKDNSNFTAHIELQQINHHDQQCIEITIDSQQSQISKFNDIDAISGLYNLQYFSDSLEHILRQAQQCDRDSQLIYIKIENYNKIRSQLGTQACRTLARDIADILNEHYDDRHQKSRLAENTFAIIYAESDTDKTQTLVNSTLTRINDLMALNEEVKIAVHGTIAIVTLSDTIVDVQQLLKRAESVVNRRENSAKVTVYSSNIDNLLKTNLQSIEQARQALEQNKLRLLFQPLVPLSFSSKNQHYEVLLRMIGNDDKEILPAHFLDSIEFADLNENMDKWVLEKSIMQNKSETALKLFISVTDTVWQREELLLWLSKTLRDSRILADQIVIQISETESVSKLGAAKYFVDGLRQLNCLICLKHYGSTSESKAILKLLDPDYVKFDSSFICELAQDSVVDPLFSDLMLELKNSGKITIAPQVEDPKVMSTLWKCGIGMVQGHYLQAPTAQMDYQF